MVEWLGEVDLLLTILRLQHGVSCVGFSCYFGCSGVVKWLGEVDLLLTILRLQHGVGCVGFSCYFDCRGVVEWLGEVNLFAQSLYYLCRLLGVPPYVVSKPIYNWSFIGYHMQNTAVPQCSWHDAIII